MKHIFSTVLIVSAGLFLSGCLNPKSSEKKLDTSAALYLTSSYPDNGNGTVTDPNGLRWMKCTYGQVWNPAYNNCEGPAGGATTYGAKSLQYCTVDGLCSDTTTLLANSGPTYDACRNLSLGGLTGWRMPTKYELGNIGSGMDRNTMLMIFPQTPDDKYFWSSSQDTTDTKLARAMSFAGSDFGTDYGRSKLEVNYLKCVR